MRTYFKMEPLKFKSCIKCGKRTRFADSFGEYVCSNQKCKFREHIDTPYFDMKVMCVNNWWTGLKNDEKIVIFKEKQSNYDKNKEEVIRKDIQ